MVFRLYSEVLWYPGRQLNIMNMLQGNSAGTTAANANATTGTNCLLLDVCCNTPSPAGRGARFGVSILTA
jgi:hypothetical protein